MQFGALLLVLAVGCGVAWGQSHDAKSPTPLAPGVNKGNVDSALLGLITTTSTKGRVTGRCIWRFMRWGYLGSRTSSSRISTSPMPRGRRRAYADLVAREYGDAG